MKLAEKLAQMSNKQATKEEEVTNEIVNFFEEKFVSGEMMDAFEKSLGKQDICSRKKNLYLEFWTYIPGCGETYFGLLDKKWRPEDDHDYEHKGVNLKNIYKDVLCEIAELTKANFEEEEFEVKIRPNEKNKRFETYVIEISW